MIVSYIQLALILCFPAMWLVPRLVTDYRVRLTVVALIAFGVPLIPAYDLMIQGYWFGVVGHLSITTTLLLAQGVLMLFCPGSKFIDDRSRKLLLIIIGVIAIGFYPLALGLSPFDPYRLGYQPLIMSACLIGFSLIVWFKRYIAAAFMILIPILGYHLNVLESNNLWDYLFDPFLVIYAWTLGVKMGYRYIHVRINVTNKRVSNNRSGH